MLNIIERLVAWSHRVVLEELEDKIFLFVSGFSNKSDVEMGKLLYITIVIYLNMVDRKFIHPWAFAQVNIERNQDTKKALEKMYKVYKKKKLAPETTGILIWLYSLNILMTNSKKMDMLGTEIWEQLHRGLPHLEQIIDEYENFLVLKSDVINKETILDMGRFVPIWIKCKQ